MPISADDRHLDDRETTSVAVELRGPVDLDALAAAAARHAASSHAVVAVSPGHAILHLTHRCADSLGPVAAIAATYAAVRPRVLHESAVGPTAAVTGEHPHADVIALYPPGVAARTLSLTTSRLVRLCAQRHGVDVTVIVSAAHAALAASLGTTGTVVTPEDRLAELITASAAERHHPGSLADGHPAVTTPADVGPTPFGDVCGDVFVLGRGGGGSEIRVYEAAGERIRVDLVDTAFGGTTPDGTAPEDHAEATRVVVDRLDGLVAHLQRLTAADLAAPGHTTVGPLDAVGGDDARRILQRWNATGEITVPATVTDLVDLALARHPDATAVVDDAAEHRISNGEISYGEFDCRINQVARSLVATGVGTDVVVGVMCVDPLWATIATLAVFRAGGGVLPIPVDATSQTVAELIESASPALVVTDQALTDTDIDPDDVMTEFVRDVGVSDILTGTDTHTGPVLGAEFGSDLRETLARNLFDTIPPWVPTLTLDPVDLAEHPDDPMCPGELSGAAKLDSVALVHQIAGGVRTPLVVTHGALAQRLQWASESADPTGTGDHELPLSVPMDAERTCAVISTLIGGAALRLSVGASSDRTALADRDRCAEEPATPVGNAHALARITSTGGTVPGWNSEMYVLDDCLRLLPPETPGTLYIGGEHIGRGLTGPSASTSTRFVANPFRPGERMVATDTVVRRDADGSLVEITESASCDVVPSAVTPAHTPVGRSGVHRRVRGHA